MSAGRRTLTTCGAVVTLLAVTGCAPAGPEASRTPPPATLKAGTLEVVSQRQPVEDSEELAADVTPGVTIGTSWIAAVTMPEGTVSVYDRDTLELAWEAENTNSWGPCGAPEFVSDDLVAVLEAFPDDFGCRRMVIYEASTGEVVRENDFVSATFGTTNTYHEIIGTERIDGRLWFATEAAVGYIDPKNGSPVTVLEEADLGVAGSEDEDWASISRLAADPGRNLLVTALLHHGNDDLPIDYYGVQVDGTSATVSWSLGEDLDQGAGLGIEGLDTTSIGIFVRGQKPGVIVAANLASGAPRAVGQLDAKTGKVRAVLTPDLLLDVQENPVTGYNVYEVMGDTLITAAAESPDGPNTILAAYDLESGEELWRLTPDLPTEDAAIADISRGTDGQLYATVADIYEGVATLSRIDLKSGKATESWDIPEGVLLEAAMSVQLVDDAVMIAYVADISASVPVSPLTFLKIAGAKEN